MTQRCYYLLHLFAVVCYDKMINKYFSQSRLDCLRDTITIVFYITEDKIKHEELKFYLKPLQTSFRKTRTGYEKKLRTTFLYIMRRIHVTTDHLYPKMRRIHVTTCSFR